MLNRELDLSRVRLFHIADSRSSVRLVIYRCFYDQIYPIVIIDLLSMVDKY